MTKTKKTIKISARISTNESYLIKRTASDYSITESEALRVLIKIGYKEHKKTINKAKNERI